MGGPRHVQPRIRQACTRLFRCSFFRMLYVNLDGAFGHLQVARDVLVAQALATHTRMSRSRGVSLPSAAASAAGVLERSCWTASNLSSWVEKSPVRRARPCGWRWRAYRLRCSSADSHLRRRAGYRADRRRLPRRSASAHTHLARILKHQPWRIAPADAGHVQVEKDHIRPQLFGALDPSMPSAVSPTISKSGYSCSSARMPLRNRAWSSTSKTRTGCGVVTKTSPGSHAHRSAASFGEWRIQLTLGFPE